MVSPPLPIVAGLECPAIATGHGAVRAGGHVEIAATVPRKDAVDTIAENITIGVDGEHARAIVAGTNAVGAVAMTPAVVMLRPLPLE